MEEEKKENIKQINPDKRLFVIQFNLINVFFFVIAIASLLLVYTTITYSATLCFNWCDAKEASLEHFSVGVCVCKESMSGRLISPDINLSTSRYGEIIGTR